MNTHEEQAFITKVIEQIREDHPTMSCRAMYYKIRPETLGRDKFEMLCRAWGYTSERRVRYHRTTDSSGVIRFENLMVSARITAMNQAFVSDITYFELDRFYYITFILDAYTRYILGHSVSDSLSTENTTLPALRMVIKSRGNKLPEGIIFHSDGGGQYYDKGFLKLTKDYHFRNSMCEFAYQNGMAERINGVIKNNYLRHWKIRSYSELKESVDRAVRLYNNEKPHKQLKMQTPLEVEKEQLNLQQQTTPRMTESFDATIKLDGACSPA